MPENVKEIERNDLTAYEILALVEDEQALLNKRFIASSFTLIQPIFRDGRVVGHTSCIMGHGQPDRLGLVVTALHGCRDTLVSMKEEGTPSTDQSIHVLKEVFRMVMVAMAEYLGSEPLVFKEHQTPAPQGQPDGQ